MNNQNQGLFGLGMPMPEQIRQNVANRLFSSSPIFGGPLGPAYTGMAQVGRGLGMALAGPGAAEQKSQQVNDIILRAVEGYEGEAMGDDFLREVGPTIARQLQEAGHADMALKVMDKIPQPEQVTAKDIAPISKEVTATIKKAADTRANAASLARLAKSGSTTDVIASTFIFMKALDPTSTVRESEQGQVYAAEGKAAQLAVFMNSLTGDPLLDKPKLEKLAATAKRLANEEINSAGSNLESMLAGYSGTRLDKTGYLDKQKARLPKTFDITWTEGGYEYRELPDGTVQRRKR